MRGETTNFLGGVAGKNGGEGPRDIEKGRRGRERIFFLLFCLPREAH